MGEDFLFFELPTGDLEGCRSSRQGYIFKHIDFNLFAQHDSKIPEDAREMHVPGDEWLSKNFWDPRKYRQLPDESLLPKQATGKAFRILRNGGMPWVCYVRDNAVSVFRRPQDGYVLEDDWSDDFETQRLFYTEEMFTRTDVLKTWIGIAEEA